MTALVKVSSIDAKAKIEPKIGPMHGVQPKPKATIRWFMIQAK